MTTRQARAESGTRSRGTTLRRLVASMALLLSSVWISGCRAQNPVNPNVSVSPPAVGVGSDSTAQTVSVASESTDERAAVVTPIPGISARAKRKLLVGANGPELLWLDEGPSRIRLMRTSLPPSKVQHASLGELATPAKLLEFTAMRTANGAYVAALLLNAGDRVEVELFRFASGVGAFQPIESNPCTGGHHTHGDGIIPYAPAKDYESIAVADAANGAIYVVWTNGVVTRLAHVDSASRVTTTALDGSGQRAMVAVDSSGQPTVLHVGSKQCGYCRPGAFLTRRVANEWKSTPIDSRNPSVPLLLEAAGRIHVALAGTSIDTFDSSSLERHSVIDAARAESAFVWAKLVDVNAAPWLVGVSVRGFIHAQVLDVRTSPQATRTIAPLLELQPLPAGASVIDVVAQAGQLHFVYSTPTAVELRRVRIPVATIDRPTLGYKQYQTLMPAQIQLGDLLAFGAVQRAPHGPFYAGLQSIHDAGCLISLSQTVKASDRSVVLPDSSSLRLATPKNDATWRLEEYVFEPPHVGDHGEDLTSRLQSAGKRQLRLVMSAAECPGRQYLQDAPRLKRSIALELGKSVNWVGSYPDVAYAITRGESGAALVAVDWTRDPIAVASVSTLGTNVEPALVRLARNKQGQLFVAYSVAAERALKIVQLTPVYAEFSVNTDDSAFAFNLDSVDRPIWVVRRGGRLVFERLETKSVTSRSLAESSAAPMALLEQADQGLALAMQTSDGIAIVARFAASGARTAELGPTCAQGYGAAAFRGASVLAMACPTFAE